MNALFVQPTSESPPWFGLFATITWMFGWLTILLILAL